MGKGALKTLFIPALAGLAIAGFLIYGNNAIETSRFYISTGKLPPGSAGLRIVHLSDLHGKEFGRENRRLAKAISLLEPDLILVSGDMIDSHNDDGSAFINLLRRLNGSFPVYCSLGNHEQIVREAAETGRYDRFTKALGEAGAVLLDNEKVTIKKEGAVFGIYGFTAALYHYSSLEMSRSWEDAVLKTQFIEERLGRPQEDEVTILLAHNPKYFPEYVNWAPDLICAGHVHGGVVRLPFLGGILSPDITFFPPYDAGLYRSGGSTMHVSRGLGNSVIPFRIFNRPDLSLIVLEPQ